jgi:hypothetical protein
VRYGISGLEKPLRRFAPEGSGDSTERLEERWSSREWKLAGTGRRGPADLGGDEPEYWSAGDHRRGDTEGGQLGIAERGGESAALAIVGAAAGRIVVGSLCLVGGPVEQSRVERGQPKAPAHEHQGEQNSTDSACEQGCHISKVEGRTGPG